MVKLSHLEDAFNSCRVVDYVYKLGLCYSVEGVLNAIKSKLHIQSDFFRIVEDIDFFFNYLWGKYSYKRLITYCMKNMERQKDIVW